MGEDFSAFVEPLYLRLDEILGKLLEAVGPDVDVLLLSDHGFHAYPFGVNLHTWLLQQGFSVPKDDVKRFGIRENDPHGLRERQMLLQLRNELDWSRTRAFADKCEGNFGGIRLNLAGREHEGVVAPEDASRVLDEIEAALRTLTDGNGRALVTNVWRGADLYPGPHVDVVPDLLFETLEDCQVFADPEEPQLLGPYGELVPDHDRNGILVAAGPSIRSSPERGDARLVDVAPTVLHLLGQPVYAEMEGRVLEDWLALERPVRTLAEADDPLLSAAPRVHEAPFTEAELEELAERLGRLGYSD